MGTLESFAPEDPYGPHSLNYRIILERIFAAGGKQGRAAIEPRFRADCRFHRYSVRRGIVGSDDRVAAAGLADEFSDRYARADDGTAIVEH